MAEHESMYAITDVPGRGKGLVATRDIARSTRILEEKPSITTIVYEESWDRAEKHISHEHLDPFPTLWCEKSLGRVTELY